MFPLVELLVKFLHASKLYPFNNYIISRFTCREQTIFKRRTFFFPRGKLRDIFVNDEILMTTSVLIESRFAGNKCGIVSLPRQRTRRKTMKKKSH